MARRKIGTMPTLGLLSENSIQKLLFYNYNDNRVFEFVKLASWKELKLSQFPQC